MTTDQLRQALRELNGERDLTIAFSGVHAPASEVEVRNAMLLPDEMDHLVKVTDGKSIFILDAPGIAWIRIGLK